MHIAFVEISNFRKLRAVRIELTESTTLFVGANNSGKTSAMVALRHFLVDRGKIGTHDLTLSNWERINAIGSRWTTPAEEGEPEPPSMKEWNDVLPSLDVWLSVGNDEIHHVSKILPTLEWQSGLLGVRLRFEPKDINELHKEYITAINDVKAMRVAGGSDLNVKLWPHSMIDFLDRRLRSLFSVRGYVLDPLKCLPPGNGIAKPQPLPDEAEAIEGDPFEGLIRIDEISAQRGFSDSSVRRDQTASDTAKNAARRESRRLSEQLRAYYTDHLDPFDRPDASDLKALEAIEHAQAAFDERLETCFQSALPVLAKAGLPAPSATKPAATIARSNIIASGVCSRRLPLLAATALWPPAQNHRPGSTPDLDDWGLSVLNPPERRDLLEILDDRHGRASTIVTSQIPVEHWRDIIGDDTLGDAILDRLVHNAHRLQLSGESMRKQNARNQTLGANSNPEPITMSAKWLLTIV